MTCSQYLRTTMEIREIAFSFFVLSLVLIGKPRYIQMWDVLNVNVLACLFDIALFYHVMLICDTKINK